MAGLESKVRLVTRNTSSEFSVRERGLYVLVGTPPDAEGTLEERQNVADAIAKKGFNVVEVDCHWPRDKFVWYKNTYVHNFPYFDEGGCFVLGKNYFVASADKEIYLDYRVRQKINPSSIEKKLKEIYNSDFYMIPSLRRRGCDPEVHLDLTISIIESRNLMLVDERHYRQQKRIFEKIAYEQSQNVLPVRLEREGALWPMNILILEHGRKTAAIANGNSKNVLKALNKYDIDIVTVPIRELPKLGGSIRCITNTFECISVYDKIKNSVIRK